MTDANSSILIEGSTFTNNTGNKGGGAIETDVTYLTLLQTSFFNNHASHGGALYIPYASNADFLVIVISNVSFINNMGSKGGALYLANFDGRIVIEDSTFRNNSADTDGGAVRCQSKGRNLTIIAKSTEFIENTARLKGGAIFTMDKEQYPYFNSSMQVMHGYFLNNKALTGGALYAESRGSISIKNSSFIGNIVILGMHWVESRNGGALHFTQNTSVNLIDTYFENNICEDRGGAIYAEGYASIYAKNITSTLNEADYGAFLHAKDNVSVSLEQANITNNNAYVSGGAVYIMGNAHLVLKAVYFINCSALSKGGAVYARDNTIISMHDVMCKENAIRKNKDSVYMFDYTSGGVIFATGKTIATIQNTTFYKSTGIDYCGSIYADEKTKLYFTDAIFRNNTVLYNGGAICAKGRSRITLDIVYFTFNNATKKGGAIFSIDNAQITLKNTLSFMNKAENGGSIYVNGGSITTENSTFMHSSATNGGSIAAVNNASLILNRSSLMNNTASYSGGAIFASQNICILLEKVTLTNNSARYMGGAINAEQNTEIIINRSTFKNNTVNYNNVMSYVCGTKVVYAIPKGGGMHSKDSGITVFDSVFNLNVADCNFSCWINESTLESFRNGFGGAISASNRGYMTLAIHNVTFLNNFAGGKGGAIHASEIIIKLNNALFENNYAMGNGAALVVNNSGEVYIQDCNFTNNSAAADSALYIAVSCGYDT